MSPTGSQIKKHQATNHDSKLGLEELQEFRARIRVLREDHSWTEISQLFNKDLRSWAKSAYESRTLAQEDDLKRARDLTEGMMEREETETSKTDTDVAARASRFENTVKELRAAGVKDLAIAEAMRYKRPREVERILNYPGKAPPLDRIYMLEEAKERLIATARSWEQGEKSQPLSLEDAYAEVLEDLNSAKAKLDAIIKKIPRGFQAPWIRLRDDIRILMTEGREEG